MATSVTCKQPCIKCDKAGGIASCAGCQQWFCIKHFSEHRQELSMEMDHLSEEHDLIQQDLLESKNIEDRLLVNINDWEQKSIEKIQIAAEQARIDVKKYLDDKKQQMTVSLHQITKELQSGRQSDDYTEVELKKWLKQIKELQELLNKPSSIRMSDDHDSQSSIHLIRIALEKKRYREKYL
ncbi:unnamed protein product [Adineta ricciae]|uniref:B box-type domain-containing protein n=1 Tax=Adineta ricciae TaxID=249248 RepID=A0A815QZC5_ADIRI|nr:unnamed protein product [Adineta ricciae]